MNEFCHTHTLLGHHILTKRTINQLFAIILKGWLLHLLFLFGLDFFVRSTFQKKVQKLYIHTNKCKQLQNATDICIFIMKGIISFIICKIIFIQIYQISVTICIISTFAQIDRYIADHSHAICKIFEKTIPNIFGLMSPSFL